MLWPSRLWWIMPQALNWTKDRKRQLAKRAFAEELTRGMRLSPDESWFADSRNYRSADRNPD
jgi:hypothetical protein